MREYQKAVIVLAAVGAVFLVGTVLDNHIAPFVIWGGCVCGTCNSLSAKCQIPPYPLLITIVVVLEVVGHYINWPPHRQ